jgi:hypothetical protein
MKTGALAGVVTDFAMFPIEKLKTRLQTSGAGIIS